MPPRWWNGKTGSPFLITSLSSPRPPIFRLSVKLSKIHTGKPLLVEFQINAFLTDIAAMKKKYRDCATMQYMSNVFSCSKMFTFISPF